ncbi:MAG: DUF2281 domain-containing protein [Saprospiraceae bacterium]
MSALDVKLLIYRDLESLPANVMLELHGLIRDFLAQKQQPKPKVKKRQFGSLKGMVAYMAPDFDAPLEDFKDYM